MLDTYNKLPRRDFLQLMAGAAAISLSRSRLAGSLNPVFAGARKTRKPNIVLIVADDWAYMDLGIAGHPLLQTPNLDRLAREGVRFTRAFTPNPICTPSRAALLTGQDCWTNGCYFFGMPIRPESKHFARLLSQAGYETFYTGKWHNDGLPSQRGFTAGKYIGGGGPGSGGHFKPMVKDFGGANKRQLEQFDSELFTDAAVQFLHSRRLDPAEGGHDQTRRAAGPFLLFISYMTPHDPWTPPGKYAAMYKPEAIELPPNFMPRPMNGSEPFKYYTDWHGKNLRDEKQMVPFPRTPAGLRDVRSRYYGTITHDDVQIGRILDKLDEQQLTGDTLVIFLADHGISLGAHGISGKQTMYEEGIRLPLVMRYPRLKRDGAENHNLVSLIDVFPTICEAAGIATPDSIEGKSLLGLYRGKAGTHRERIFASFVSPTRHRLNIRCIRTERYKLIHHLTTDEVELYDLKEDPYELNNLARQKRFSKLKKRLAAELLAWRTKAESKESRVTGNRETRVSGKKETRERRDLA